MKLFIKKNNPHPRSVAVVCSHLLDGELDIHYASRDIPIDAEDSGWQFICCIDDHSEDSGGVIILENLIKQDASLLKIINAAPGTCFIKQNSNWKKEHK